jgi:hypothetical protein
MRRPTSLGSTQSWVNEIAPFAAVLLRSESASSSRIENLTSSARSIALAELRTLRQLVSDKKRNRFWQAPEVLSALEGFAARAGRRG